MLGAMTTPRSTVAPARSGRSLAVVAVALAAATLTTSCGRRGRDRGRVVALPVELVASADPALALEVRQALLEPGPMLAVGVVVTNRGETTFTGVEVAVELITADGAVGGTLPVRLVGFHERQGWLYPGHQVAGSSGGWNGVWHRPVRLRARVSQAERQRGEPPPPPPVPQPIAVRARSPLPAGTVLTFASLWGGTGAEGEGPSAGRVLFDLELLVTNTGTTSVWQLPLAAVFEDAAGVEVDRLDLPSSHWPALAPGDRRTLGAARGVRAHARWHLEHGEVALDTARPPY